MADQKISQLNNIAGANVAADDEFVIVDTDANETKAIRADNIRAAIGLATTDSPTFAGLTVNTSTFYVDAASNRVGIGTTSPAYKLHVDGGSSFTSMGLTSTNSTQMNFSAGIPERDGGTNGVADFIWRTNGVARWILRKNSTAETGTANFGSDFEIFARADDGSGLSLPFSINRRTQNAQLSNTLYTYFGSVGIGTTSPGGALDVVSTTKAFLPPRMTTAQRDAIASPTAGMVIYNTTTNVLNFHNGTAWGAV